MGSPIEKLKKRDQYRIFALAIMERLNIDEYAIATTLAQKCDGIASLEEIKQGTHDGPLKKWYQEELRRKNIVKTNYSKKYGYELRALYDKKSEIDMIAKNYIHLYNNDEITQEKRRAV